MTKKPRWSVKGLHSEMVQVEKRLSARRAEAAAVAAKPVSPDDARQLAELSVSLMDLGLLDSVQGALRVLDSDQDGWLDLDQGFLWKYYEQRTLKRLFDQDRRPSRRPRSNPRDLALVTMHGLAVGRSQVAWCRSELRNSLDGGAFDKIRSYPLGPYALWLVETADSQATAKYEGNPASVYGQVVSAWSDDDRLRDAMSAMCDFHVNRTVDTDDSELWMEFETHPYPIFPVEYLALVRVRESLGLTIPKCDHPLLGTPLAQLPSTIATSRNREFEHLEAL
jgi:hypothetical protein